MKKLKNSTNMIPYSELNSIVANSFSNLNFNSEPQNLYEPIKYILGIGGKRIRPILTLAGCNVFSDDIKSAINPAIAVEIFHNFTLVHDDIMDNADLRRGNETIHKKWNNNIAILSGDAMTIIAYQYLASSNPKYLGKIVEIFSSFALGICEGQQLDMDFENRKKVTRDEYLKMIELKTSILLKGALQIGAVLGGANDDDVKNIGEFGRCLGLAFQLQDDLLDTYGNVETFGKNIGGDIMAGKKTILTIETIERLGNKVDDFIELLGSNTLPRESKVNEVIRFYNEVGVKEIVEGLIDDYFKKAHESLTQISVSEERKAVLVEISQKLMNRKN
ncbi:MAG TPA: polyprenyl synthetase family protein [Tenuifilaceae bacterium]|nr:polyprenyl synthetase family protein [Tenuifilaceae bacterium]HPI43589.1 polyprenyl synthetase family protein [Tenuifilaceae bacterium]HPN21542.1 polyprenyl synthetase family protein [Tenuifilaceae bacterium]